MSGRRRSAMARVTRLLRSAALLLLLAAAAPAAYAEVRALLIGVSGYPGLAPALRLNGPPQDVAQLREVLLRRGVPEGRIRVLADGMADKTAGAEAPTRAAILDAWARLAREAGPGDTVIVHFSGHGSRQPDRDRPGVLVPTLLPLDVGRWDGSARAVGNALTRDEVRAAIDRIGERGAFVWAVFDACHSSALVRGAGSAEAAAEHAAGATQWRGVDPADLGVPVATLNQWPSLLPEESARTDAAATRGGGELQAASARGRSVYFYASRASEFAGELDLPAGAAGARRRGLLSFVLAGLLDEQRPVSYRQLGQAVLATYRTIDGARVSPVFSGDGLDTQVLGQSHLALRQWPLRGPAEGGTAWRVGAGHLQGIGEGAVFAVLPNALARDDEVLGYLETSQVGLDESPLAPLAGGGRPAPAAATLRAGAQHLRLISNPFAFALRVAVDDSAGCAAPCRSNDAIKWLRASGVPGVDLRWVGATDAPDLLVRAQTGRVLLLTPAEAANASGVRADGPPSPAAISAAIPVAITATIAAPPGLPAAALGRQIGERLHAHARIRNLSLLAARSATEPLQNTLAATLSRRGDGLPLDTGSAPVLHHGDRLVLRLDNRGQATLDVTVLYLDADEGIARVFPSTLGDVNRLEAGESREIGVRIQPPSTGRERLMLIGAQVGRSDDSIDFGFLEQASMPQRRDNSEAVGDVLGAFADAAFADHLSRGERQPRPPSARTLVRSIELEVRREAVAAPGRSRSAVSGN